MIAVMNTVKYHLEEALGLDGLCGLIVSDNLLDFNLGCLFLFLLFL